MADPYWDTIDDGSQVIGSYDITKGERSPIDAFQLEVDRKAKELQDLLDLRDMAKAEAEKAMSYTGRNPIEQAIVGLAPMALGAILGGKQGLGAGGIGAVAGLKAYDSYADEEAKRQQLIASQFYKDAQANVTASQKAMDALRGKQTEMSVDHQNDLEIAMLNNEAKKQIKAMGGDGSGLDQPVEQAVIDQIEQQTGMKFPVGVSKRGADLIIAAGEKGKDRDERLKKIQYSAEDEIYDLEAIRTNGLTYFKPPLDPKKDMMAAIAHTRILSSYDKLKALYDKRAERTQPLTDTEELKEATAAYNLAADILLATKDIEGLGAAFTDLEKRLASLKSGSGDLSPEEVFSTISKDMLFGTSAESRARYGREMAIENMANQFSKRGAVLNGVDYSSISPRLKEELVQRGVTWGEDGKPIARDAIQARIDQLRQRTTRSEPMGQTQQQQKKPLKQFLQENGINYNALDEKAQVRALADMKRAGYKDDEIAKVLGGNNANP